MKYITKKIRRVHGEIKMPGDKSICHRAVLTGSIAEGDTVINNFSPGNDCLSTIGCIKECGIEVEMKDNYTVIVRGRGLKGLKKPVSMLDAGNSGTTMRLISGILCAQNFESSISGDLSLRNRPMDRIIKPLSMMGAFVEGNSGYAPLNIKGSKLKGIEYHMPFASAQVKSAVLYASLFAESVTHITEPVKSRDHTEIMLNSFGAAIDIEGTHIVSSPAIGLIPQNVIIPGDISSAAYFITAAAIIPGSRLLVRDVGTNPTRTGLIDALKSMGAEIEIINPHFYGGEAAADILVHGGMLSGTNISGEIIPRLIDEIPVLCAAAIFADGTTKISGAGELRIKESDRIKSMVTNLRLLGADVEESSDGMIIRGCRDKLHGNYVRGYRDHRIVMAMAVAGAALNDEIAIDDASSVSISFPGFFGMLESLS